MDPAIYGCICYYAASIYPVFERVGYRRAELAAKAAESASVVYPLFMRDKKGQFPEVDIPCFGKKSTPFAAAVMAAFLVWTQRAAGFPLPTSPILQAADDGYNLWKMEHCGCTVRRVKLNEKMLKRVQLLDK